MSEKAQFNQFVKDLDAVVSAHEDSLGIGSIAAGFFNKTVEFLSTCDDEEFLRGVCKTFAEKLGVED